MLFITALLLFTGVNGQKCPADCVTWFDGCNNCACDNGEVGPCTRKFCDVFQEPKCVKHADVIVEKPQENICPADCTKWYDGCNECICVNGKTTACTERMCFTQNEPKCLDKPTVDEPKCPADCKVWYDGCNTCKCNGNGGAVGCTMKMCIQKEEPKCLESTGGEVEEPKCPADCTNWFDGCNNCKCDGNGNIVACTKKFCPKKKETKCMDKDEENPKVEEQKCPSDCTSWFDGCNTCKCDGKGKVSGCTRKFCAKEDYQEPKCLKDTFATPAPKGDKCPKGCSKWFDGCNNCSCDANGNVLACTKKFCMEKEKPKCMDEVAEKKCPADCSSWFDGCNNCRCDGNGNILGCTKKFCLKYDEPKCMDTSLETPSPIVEPKCPADCATWFDGCNTCKCDGNGTILGCTKKFCKKFDEPKCVDNKQGSISFDDLKSLCDAAKFEEDTCKAFCGGKFNAKKGCKGYKKAKSVKCKKIQDPIICEKIGCGFSSKKGKTKCAGKAFKN